MLNTFKITERNNGTYAIQYYTESGWVFVADTHGNVQEFHDKQDAEIIMNTLKNN